MSAPRFGPSVAADGVTFRVWAPGADVVELVLIGPAGERTLQPMARLADGWHARHCAEVRPGQLYRFRFGGSLEVADPASRANPQGPFGPSQVVDPDAHRWRDAGWRGRPWREVVLYELHVGSFTPEGTFAAAAQRLESLAALGITAVQLMPVAEFAGTRGWGYDGVLLFAPASPYGPPEALKALVDTAHVLGLMVLLDAVYNHFGPEGNFLPAWCPEFFDPQRHTPWGAGIAFHGPHSAEVRRFFVENALYWVEQFHADGLRLDAVHALRDPSAQHIVAEIVAALEAGPGRDRQVHVVLENDDNTASWLQPGTNPVVAQWNDDFHHAAHVLATGEVESYYADFASEPAALLGRALAEGFVYQGQPCGSRNGRGRGEPSAGLPPEVFVNFLQSHDQVGNRAFGERLDALVAAPRIEALLACLLLAPATPMLFMGEEFGAASPFLYFCDFQPELAQQVTAGRRNEFARFEAFRDPQLRERVPDPNAIATFDDSKLRWAERDARAGRQRLALVTRLLALRRTRLLPHLPAELGATCRIHGRALQVEWPLAGGCCWLLRVNFGEVAASWAVAADEQVVYASMAVSLAEPVIDPSGAPDARAEAAAARRAGDAAGADAVLGRRPDAVSGAVSKCLPDAAPNAIPNAGSGAVPDASPDTSPAALPDAMADPLASADEDALRTRLWLGPDGVQVSWRPARRGPAAR